MDIVDSNTRSRMMSGIRGENTRPEILVRSLTHRMGYRHRNGHRYRIDNRLLPGRPDLVFPKFRAVIQVNGCFWHQHDCHLFKWPSSRKEFWREKLAKNRARDEKNVKELASMGWRVLTVWECALKGKLRYSIEDLAQLIDTWIKEGKEEFEIKG